MLTTIVDNDGLRKPTWKKKVAGRSASIKRNRVSVKLTLAPPGGNVGSPINTSTRSFALALTLQVSCAGICSANGDYSLARKDLRRGERETLLLQWWMQTDPFMPQHIKKWRRRRDVEKMQFYSIV